jgi:hypothetical protein
LILLRVTVPRIDISQAPLPVPRYLEPGAAACSVRLFQEQERKNV